MADALSEKTGQDLAKALKNLTESINKGGIGGKSSGGETSKNQVDTEQKINGILAKRLKDSKDYQKIMDKIKVNNEKAIKYSKENEKLEKQKLLYIQKQTEFEKLRDAKAAYMTKSQLVAHGKMLKSAEAELKKEAEKYKLLEKEVKLEKEKAKIEAKERTDNAKSIARQEKFDKAKAKVSEKLAVAGKATGNFLLEQGKAILNNVLNADSAISKLSANYALSKTESGYLKKNIGEVAWQTQRIGVGFEDLTKMQTSYTDQMGRSVMLGKDNMISMAQTSVALGLGVEATGKMAADMDLFGIGVKDSMNLFAEMTDLAKKSGVSASVTAKKFEGNLKLANTYNFKNGVEGVKRMTVEATKLGIKMESVAALADKVSSPEGAIETAAKLQVLGGSFAQMADPMMLLNQGITDMEGLTKTYSKMLDNVISVNSKTGEINENGYEKIRVKAAAEAAGISFDDMMNASRTKAKRAAITSQLEVNTNIKEEDKDLIASLATFDKGIGAYTVNVKGQQKTVTKLDKADLEYIKPQEAKISDIAENTMGIREILQNNLVALYSAFSGVLLPLLNDLSKILLTVFGKIDNFISPGVTEGINMSSGVGSNLAMPNNGNGVMGGTGAAISLAKWLGAGGKTMSKIGGIGAVAGGAMSGGAEYMKTGDIGKSFAVGGGSAIGGLAGAAIGQMLIPIPGVGALIGGVAGSMLGEAIGRYSTGNSQTNSINDGIISKDGKVTRINDSDSILAFKPGGQIDRNGILPSPNQRVFQGISQPIYGSYNGNNNGDTGVGKIDVSGVITLNLVGGGTANLNANDLIHNQQFLKLMARKLSAQINRDANGGKQSTSLGPDAI